MKKLAVYLLSVCCCVHLALSLKCEPDTEKICTATCNGTEYDISRLMKKYSPIPATIDNKSYMFYLSCSGKKCGTNNISSTVCQNEIDDTNKRQWSCGDVNSGATWSFKPSNPLTLQVTYTGGDEQTKGKNRKTVIEITVDDGATKDEFAFDQEDKSATYNFHAVVRRSGSIEPSSSSSSSADVSPGIIGWVIIFLAIVGFIGYFILGSIYMYVGRGASGIEVIPNLEFWKNFPVLLKDGFLFTISPCLGLKNKAYEKI